MTASPDPVPAVPGETRETRYTLSSIPSLGSLCGVEQTTLVTGCELQDDGSVRVYVGPRYRGAFLLVTDPDEQEFFRRGWQHGGHVWLSPLPPAAELHKVAP